MTGDKPPDQADNDSGSSRNAQGGNTHQVVQARDIHGNVNITPRPAQLRWWFITGLVTVLAATGVIWLRSSGSTAEQGPDQAPSTFRVTADLSANDNGPRGYASEDPGFLSTDLIERLSRPMAAYDHSLARSVRQTGGDAFENLHRDLALEEVVKHGQALDKVATEPISLQDCEHVAGPHVVDRSLQAGAIGDFQFPGPLLLEHPDADRIERIVLSRGLLFSRANPDEAY